MPYLAWPDVRIFCDVTGVGARFAEGRVPPLDRRMANRSRSPFSKWREMLPGRCRYVAVSRNGRALGIGCCAGVAFGA